LGLVETESHSILKNSVIHALPKDTILEYAAYCELKPTRVDPRKECFEALTATSWT
jgi:hypothetical protein